MKLTTYAEIRQHFQFIREGDYEVDYELPHVWDWVSRQMSGRDGDMVLLNIDPDFQRPHVWKERQQRMWLEFFMRGGRTGRVLYFNHPSWMRGYNKGEFVLVDGKQRLEAIRRWMADEIKVFGSYKSEYTDSCRMLSNTIKINVNTLPTKAEVLRWYVQMNGGGTPHSKKDLLKVLDLLKEEENNG
jgi:hypothetical protein